MDRFEQETLDFHERIRQAYLKQATMEPERIAVINAEFLEIEEVFEKVKEVLSVKLII